MSCWLSNGVWLPLLLMLAEGQDPHRQSNPLYRELREVGWKVDGREFRLPAPTLPDGLDAATQKKVLEQLIGDDYTLDDFLRPSPVAPQILRINDLKSTNANAVPRSVDLWFVVYADLDAKIDEAFVRKVLSEGKREGQAVRLNADELAARQITLSAEDAKHESYGHARFDLLDRVEIWVTGQSRVSRSEESIVVASRIDPRFRNDDKYPNRWKPIPRDGDTTPIEAKPYDGGIQYLKITRLAEPKGALFVEYHVIFLEPIGWFDGANLLRSKLPAAAQALVRSLRREAATLKK